MISACYAVMKDWQKAYEDAVVCISKDSKFIKGYYRLASAQTELKKYDDAISTVRAALTIEPGNEVLARQMNTIQAKKAGKTAQVAKKPAKQLDDAQIKELMTLQEETATYSRELRIVKAKMGNIQREARMNQVTYGQINVLEDKTNLYRGVGKAFVKVSKSAIEQRLDDETQALDKDYGNLNDRQQYLERRIQANTNNMKDIAC